VIVMWEADKDQIKDALMQAVNVSHMLQHKHVIVYAERFYSIRSIQTLHCIIEFLHATDTKISKISELPCTRSLYRR
jgi:hypothetical protein